MQQRNPQHGSNGHVVTLSDQHTIHGKQETQWTLLVVDAEREAAELSASILREEGHHVEIALSGAAALTLMRETPVDLVITDMVMPGMDGMQFLANIKEMHPDTDVIVLTGFGTIEDAVEAMRRGAADFLPKPFRPRDLKRLIASVLRTRHADREETFQAQSASLLELSYVLARTADIHALPGQAVELARESFDADVAVVLDYEPARKSLTVLVHAGRDLSAWGQAEDLSRQGMEAIEQRRLLLSAEVGSGNCYAYVPLIVASEPKGVLCLRRDGGPWFHERTTDLLEIFATHLALSLETARLYHHASGQVAELEDLMSVGQSLALDADKESICQQLLSGANGITDAEICAVLLTDGGHDIIRTSPVMGEDSPLMAAVRNKMLALLGRTLPEAAGPQAISVTARLQMTSVISAPLRIKETTYGLLAAFSSTPNCFELTAARRLTALATHAASGMANASALERVSAMYFETIEMIGNLVDSTNRYTLGHSRQVRTFSGALARGLNLSDAEVCVIEDGGLLHDIGKLCIPQTLLDKPGALTAEEFAIVASHPAHGANMMKDAPHMQAILPILRHHHESYAGSGYPDGLCGEMIPLGARMVALADMFDALVSHRIYRPAMSFAVARNMIAERAGSQFDPDLVRVFLELPLETLVEH